MYNWIIWFHILSFISWYAVLFYMPRLFVYHAENAENEGFVKVVKVMEMKIYKYIGIPAMWATVISGVAMIFLSTSHYGGVNIMSTGGWMHAKILFVLILIAYFFSLGYFRIKFLNDECKKSGKFFRAYNEVPTLLLLVIVAMVIIKPF
ncbi:protoporphyrinogen oxidase HemJ [Sulfurimonas sp. CVO]|uniref:Protoporphyrinogen IX oxidase n=1 Tax=Sulfurimonas xiamenensis TaxID=2590021 RepID=A0AAJ4A2H4_9BACT|nr:MULTISPECIES: protoporphyrinogen oxidase HemJ [Sulfurimonas]PLY12243.1 MAG: protoporphyrinogen oxidase HemJ [Sulfurimonas sp.]QFR42678.1 protoporphyrinogen oxidase HemJ [Sulfurimonas xiamenensis]QHG91731.1 protoporphyrinogen oxidase HemJ [Sulfurimonas sp. CVO]